MRPIPPSHVRTAHVIALDIPIPPPVYLTFHSDRLDEWLRRIIELGLEHADQDDVDLVGVRGAADVLEDPDLAEFIGPRKPSLEHFIQVAHERASRGAATRAPDSAPLRTMARRLAQQRRRAHAWKQEAEQLRADLDRVRQRADDVSTFGAIRSQEIDLELEHRPGRVFVHGSPEPKCERVLAANGVVFKRQSAGGSYSRWVAQPPKGDGAPYSWSQLVGNGLSAWPLTEMLPLV